MPIFDESRVVEDILYNERKGTLFVLFNIVFPKFIKTEKKEEIIKLLEQAEY